MKNIIINIFIFNFKTSSNRRKVSNYFNVFLVYIISTYYNKTEKFHRESVEDFVQNRICLSNIFADYVLFMKPIFTSVQSTQEQLGTCRITNKFHWSEYSQLWVYVRVCVCALVQKLINLKFYTIEIQSDIIHNSNELRAHFSITYHKLGNILYLCTYIRI